MKTRCLSKGRNMFRMSFDQELVEILRGPLCLCSCVRMRQACVHNLYSCVRICVHQFNGCTIQHMYACSDLAHVCAGLRVQVSTQKP